MPNSSSFVCELKEPDITGGLKLRSVTISKEEDQEKVEADDSGYQELDAK